MACDLFLSFTCSAWERKRSTLCEPFDHRPEAERGNKNEKKDRIRLTKITARRLVQNKGPSSNLMVRYRVELEL